MHTTPQWSRQATERRLPGTCEGDNQTTSSPHKILMPPPARSPSRVQESMAGTRFLAYTSPERVPRDSSTRHSHIDARMLRWHVEGPRPVSAPRC